MIRFFSRILVTGILLVVSGACAFAQPAATEPPAPSGHVAAYGAIPLSFGSYIQQTSADLTSALYAGTFGTYALATGIHVMFPVREPFYVSATAEYGASMYTDYLLKKVFRYRWTGSVGGIFGITRWLGKIGEFYAGAGLALAMTADSSPATVQTRWNPMVSLETGIDFRPFKHVSVGPRVSAAFGPSFGTASSVSTYGYVSFSILAGYGF